MKLTILFSSHGETYSYNISWHFIRSLLFNIVLLTISIKCFLNIVKLVRLKSYVIEQKCPMRSFIFIEKYHITHNIMITLNQKYWLELILSQNLFFMELKLMDSGWFNSCVQLKMILCYVIWEIMSLKLWRKKMQTSRLPLALIKLF